MLMRVIWLWGTLKLEQINLSDVVEASDVQQGACH